MRRAIIFFPVFFALTALFSTQTAPAAFAQQPTETPIGGLFITVITDEPQINVRMGPSSTVYPVVGVLPTGAVAPALGRSPGGDWVQIEFSGAPNGVGWVYSPLVMVSPPGVLRIVEPPPTPVPPATATIDPTFAAQFTIVPTQPRLPTFTPPPSLVAPSYTQTPAAPNDSIPLAMMILALAALGMVGFILSSFTRR
ncbi:MAG: hypothetical protein Fur002_00100 [Anaerolineales bacterium]